MENNCYNTYEINIYLRNNTAWSVEQKLGVIFPKSQQRECSSRKVLYQRGSTTPTLQYPNTRYSQKRRMKPSAVCGVRRILSSVVSLTPEVTSDFLYVPRIVDVGIVPYVVEKMG
jgi:hypothetical protein